MPVIEACGQHKPCLHFTNRGGARGREGRDGMRAEELGKAAHAWDGVG